MTMQARSYDELLGDAVTFFLAGCRAGDGDRELMTEAARLTTRAMAIRAGLPAGAPMIPRSVVAGVNKDFRDRLEARLVGNLPRLFEDKLS
jgi:hypothetical protein